MPHGRAAQAGIRRQNAGSDRVLLIAAAVGMAWLAIYTALTAFAMHSEELGRFVGNVLYLLPIGAATVLSVIAAARTQGRVRLAWRLLVVSNTLWLAGEIVWSTYAYLRPDGAPIPSAADVGYLLQYLIALPAILIGLGLGVLGRGRGLLDALLVAVAVGALGWQLAIGPLVPGSWNAAALTTFLYPVFSVSIVSVLIAVAVCNRHRMPRSMILAGGSMVIAGAAFGLAAVSDAGYAYYIVQHSYTDWSWVNLGWQAEAVLLCLAALVAARRSEGDERLLLYPETSNLPAVVAFLTVSGLAVADLTAASELSHVTIAVIMLLLLGLLLRQLIASRDRTRLTRQLRTAAITDPLTGLHNRRFFEEMLHLEAGLAARQHAPLTLILIDLDHFKDVNDTFGHSVGDSILVEAAHRLRRSLRASDLIARYGGEEFVCLLPSTDEDSAVEVAEHLRSALGRTPMAVPGNPDGLVVTASLGVATARTSPQDASIDIRQLIEAADQAVYRAKASGRNRVAGSGRFAQPDLGPEKELPPALLWLADQIDGVLGDREHATAVARWSLRTAARLGLDQDLQRRTADAARLHDIGKIGISRALLAKPGPLSAQEWDQIRHHPEEGARLLVEWGDRPDLAPAVAAHHERFDGSGYPRGLAGTDIPVEARIIAVCDAWAAMRTIRSYSSALTTSQAREEVALGRGTQFDPVVADAFLALVDEGAIDEPAPLRTRSRPLPSASSPLNAEAQATGTREPPRGAGKTSQTAEPA